MKLIAAIDPVAARCAATEVATELDGLAAQVWAFGMSEDPRRALAIVAQMGAELAMGAIQLYESGRWYAGAALVRQLIEVEYLLFLFAHDHQEPERWLLASSEDARRMFTPAAMRERSDGRFRSEEYSVHCEIGGHPRPQGSFLLREHFTSSNPPTVERFDPGGQWVDLAQHIERLWTNYVEAVKWCSPHNVYPERFQKVDAALVRWRAIDKVPPKI